MSSKGDVLRWAKAFAKAKAVKPAAAPPLSRYTNLSLGSVWAKYDCQTQLLCREALIPVMSKNPAMLDVDVELNPVNVTLDIGAVPKSGAFEKMKQ